MAKAQITVGQKAAIAAGVQHASIGGVFQPVLPVKESFLKGQTVSSEILGFVKPSEYTGYRVVNVGYQTSVGRTDIKLVPVTSSIIDEPLPKVSGVGTKGINTIETTPSTMPTGNAILSDKTQALFRVSPAAASTREAILSKSPVTKLDSVTYKQAAAQAEKDTRITEREVKSLGVSGYQLLERQRGIDKTMTLQGARENIAAQWSKKTGISTEKILYDDKNAETEQAQNSQAASQVAGFKRAEEAVKGVLNDKSAQEQPELFGLPWEVIGVVALVLVGSLLYFQYK